MGDTRSDHDTAIRLAELHYKLAVAPSRLECGTGGAPDQLARVTAIYTHFKKIGQVVVFLAASCFLHGDTNLLFADK